MHFVMNKRYSEFQTLRLLARTIVGNRSDHVTFGNAMTHGPARPAQHIFGRGSLIGRSWRYRFVWRPEGAVIDRGDLHLQRSGHACVAIVMKRGLED